VLKRDKPEAVSIARDLVPWLLGRGAKPVIPEENAGTVPNAQVVPLDALAGSIDVLVVLGGDGTLLHGCSLVADAGVPILGINLGRLGFLTPFDRSEAQAALERAITGALPIEERMRLRVALHSNGAEPIIKTALNDAVIAQGAMARLVELHTTLDGQKVTLYKADGLIVCTPTGSTAYNLAAGGPILPPSQGAMAITPICPHTLTNRPLVVSHKSTIGIELTGESTSVLLTVDGQSSLPVHPGDRLEIRRADVGLKLYRSEKSYFEILRSKLRWGEREG
jgi:NAD+ kinase